MYTSLQLCQRQRDEIRQERDAAIERVAVLETRMAAVFCVMSQHPDTKASELDARIDEYLASHLITF
jgi:hypothetical protein